MNFLHLNYLPGLLVCFMVFVAVVFLLEKRFFNLIRRYWFYRRSTFSYLSSILIVLGIGGLLLSLLDPRGPEEKVKTTVPKDRTIILIDTSASMLAEDVKPSRLQKAALIAKHFARRAAGHQISVVAFAEIQKKIVPFTNDLDLIDARLDSLKTLRNQYGSSALSVAIQESIQYFREADGEASGNILILTDGEETAAGIDLKIPDQVHIALVGVGSEQGGRIPLDDGRGFRFGYKKDGGKDVITKLNEKFFQKITSDVSGSKYWIANSYSLPSEEIMEYFNTKKSEGLEQQDMVIRPVMMEWIVVPSLILLMLGYLFKVIRVFSLGLLLLILPVHAAEDEPQLSPEVTASLQDLKDGKLSQLEKLKLADDLYKADAKDEALSLYRENLPPGPGLAEGVPPEAYLNYGTGLLEKGEIGEGLRVYENLETSLPADSAKGKEVKEIIEKNSVTVFRKIEEQKKKEQEKKDQEKKDGAEKKEKNQGGEGKQGEPKPQGSESGKQDKGAGQDPGKDQKKENDQKGEDKDQKPADGAGEENKKEEKSPDGKEDSKPAEDGEGQKPKAQKKLPAKLKQLMSDDRQLQMKMIENGTRDLNKRKSRGSKDW
ncbi:MAG TPA: VWA domain-containing protein [Bacteriovoracaceae bacterium]|nr:VWA domain-containing protein [Bacteriovoracaceae bacterium]